MRARDLYLLYLSSFLLFLSFFFFFLFLFFFESSVIVPSASRLRAAAENARRNLSGGARRPLWKWRLRDLTAIEMPNGTARMHFCRISNRVLVLTRTTSSPNRSLCEICEQLYTALRCNSLSLLPSGCESVILLSILLLITRIRESMKSSHKRSADSITRVCDEYTSTPRNDDFRDFRSTWNIFVNTRHHFPGFVNAASSGSLWTIRDAWPVSSSRSEKWARELYVPALWSSSNRRNDLAESR